MSDFFKPDIPDDDSTVYHVGISGGKDSTAVLLWMVHESGVPKHRINATFCDTGNEHEWTYAQVELLSRQVHPIETLKPDLGFFDLAFKKRRFPSSRRRFCTQHLKIYPTQDHVQYLQKAYKTVVAVSGVRADESEERSTHLEWDYSGELLTLQWRPLIRWSIKDVLAIHERYGVPLNPLYGIGAQRVGCFPCIMSRKAEIRLIAQKFPERIAMIREAEQRFEREYGRYSSFFARNAVPERFRSKVYVTSTGESMNVATIDDVVQWSMTGKRAQGSWTDEPEEKTISCSTGFCE